MAHVLNSLSFFEHWTAVLPDSLDQYTADAVTDCMAAIWSCLYRTSEAYKSGASPLSSNINIKNRDITSAASAAMSDKSLYHICKLEDCSPKHAHELTRRFTVIIFQICILVEQRLELEDMDKDTDTEAISFDF